MKKTTGSGMRAVFVLAAFALLGAGAARPAMADSDYLLEIDGIKGESTDARHKNAIEIESFSFGATAPSSEGGGGRTGKVSFQDIQFSKPLDRSSPKLLQALATGVFIKKATLYVRKAGRDQQEYYRVVLEEVLVSSYSVSGAQGSNDGVPVDQFSLSYGKISTIYTPRKADGSTDVPELSSTPARSTR